MAEDPQNGCLRSMKRILYENDRWNHRFSGRRRRSGTEDDRTADAGSDSGTSGVCVKSTVSIFLNLDSTNMPARRVGCDGKDSIRSEPENHDGIGITDGRDTRA